jgi:3-hydroxyacyl-[acyl-carrier-protein] dehydratase
MLKDNFFRLSGPVTGSDGTYSASIRLEPDHAIFAGHFPGLPVVPGVCMMAIIKEILQEIVHRPLRLVQAGNLKFLSLINPLQNESVNVELKFTEGTDETLVLDGSIFTDNLIFFKINRAVYR